MSGRVLIIAGSDSGGGAGIQADIKAVTALGGYAATAITALTAQNTRGVSGILPVGPGFVRRQIEAVLSDIGSDCVKTGMLVDAARDLGFDLTGSWMIGDTNSDIAAGRAAGCKTVLIEYPGSAHKRLQGARPDVPALSLGDGVAQLLDHDAG